MSRTHPKSTAAAEARCFRMSKELLSLLPAFLAAEQYPFDIDLKELEDHLESFMREPSVIELFEEEEVAPSTTSFDPPSNVIRPFDGLLISSITEARCVPSRRFLRGST